MYQRPGLPPTDCESCAAAERPPARLRDKILALAAVAIAPLPSPVMAALGSAGTVMAMMMGGEPRSWYDRHREAWVRDGDLAELHRMVRHVRRARKVRVFPRWMRRRWRVLEHRVYPAPVEGLAGERLYLTVIPGDRHEWVEHWWPWALAHPRRWWLGRLP